MMIAQGVVAVIALGFALAWVAPVVGTTNSACERYPYTSGCRLPRSAGQRDNDTAAACSPDTQRPDHDSAPRAAGPGVVGVALPVGIPAISPQAPGSCCSRDRGPPFHRGWHRRETRRRLAAGVRVHPAGGHAGPGAHRPRRRVAGGPAGGDLAGNRDRAAVFARQEREGVLVDGGGLLRRDTHR